MTLERECDYLTYDGFGNEIYCTYGELWFPDAGPKYERKECPKCNGTGKIHWTYESLDKEMSQCIDEITQATKRLAEYTKIFEELTCTK